MKTARIILIALLCSVLVLSGCKIPTATPVLKGGGGGDCSGAPAPVGLNSPPQWSIASDLTPTLNWVLTDPACTPDSYNVHVRSGPFFQDDLGGSSTTTSWAPSTDLMPGTEYAWGVEAVNDGITGPYAGEGYFFTGPVCGGDNLKAPVLLSPLNNGVYHDLSNLSLKWDYPDTCLPGHYEIQITNNLLFDSSPLNGVTSTASTRWAPASPLADCNRYFWRVRAVKGSTKGPFSDVYNFKVAISGGCPPEANGIIQGTVWEDQCAGLGPGTPVAPDSLPLGCVLNGDQIWTNATYDPGEPGIPNAIVTLYHNACPPSVPSRAIPTGPGGVYSIYMVSPGTYCVAVDPLEPMNLPIFLPGNWTYPVESAGQTIAMQTIVVDANTITGHVNFGWWYKFGTPWGDTSATVFGQVWSDLCAYHQGDPIPDPLPAGCIQDDSGIHADAVKQPGEPGIAGVTVDIGPGPCPSAGLATAETDVNGYYHFDGLSAGDYCLRIDPAHGSPNEAILMPGQWTVIPSGHEGMTFRAISLTANQTLPGQDFGWDFDEALPTPTLTPTLTPTFTLEPTFTLTPTLFPVEPPFLTLDVNANCRKAPWLQAEASAVGRKGESYHINGLSQDSDWLRVRYSAAFSCWMAKSTGKITGSLSNVQVIFMPTDTPTQPPAYCAQFTTQRQCIAHGSAGCKWVVGIATPYCSGP